MWYGGGYGPGMSGWGGGLMGGLHGLFWLVLLVLVGLALVALVRYLWRAGESPRAHDNAPLSGRGGEAESPASGSSARRILDERYARGEIERAEYLQRRQDLG